VVDLRDCKLHLPSELRASALRGLGVAVSVAAVSEWNLTRRMFGKR